MMILQSMKNNTHNVHIRYPSFGIGAVGFQGFELCFMTNTSLLGISSVGTTYTRSVAKRQMGRYFFFHFVFVFVI